MNAFAQGLRAAAAPRAAVALVVAALSAASASSSAAAGTPWVSVGLLAGMVQEDPQLADYQWSDRASGTWGLQTLAGVGRWSGGLRWITNRTTQSFDAAGGDEAVVRISRLEAIGRTQVGSFAGIQFEAGVGLGWARMSWDPDRASIDTPGGPLEVAFDPIDELVASGTLVAHRALTGGFSVGLELEHHRFALDTAHRDGSGIVEARESFGGYGARLELARRFGR